MNHRYFLWKMVRLTRNDEVSFLFIHIGGDTVVRTKDIISIINANEINLKRNSTFLKNLEKVFQVKIKNEEIKSYVITVDKIYYSPISSLTLNKRANNYK